MRERIEQWVTRFALDDLIQAQVVYVLAGMPTNVRDDIMNDESFVLSDYEPIPGSTLRVMLQIGTRGRAGRSVVLKRTLRRRPVEFARWVIAHELAHAHLRNGGRWKDDDPEIAADVLAASWGFPRP